MTDNKTHNKIFKSISIFGSVQAIQMVCKIISVKITTEILGPSGVGLIGLIDNVINLITQGSSFGIQTIGTQLVAKERENKSNQKVLFIWMFICGVLAGLFCFVFSGFLSKITFDSDAYSIHFKALSVYFVFFTIINFSIIVLKGLNEIKKLIKYQIISTVLISLSTISCYVLWGIDGIFPAFIATSLVTFIVYSFYLWKLDLKAISITKSDFLSQGKYLFSKGSLLALNGVFGLVCFFLIRLYLKESNPEYLGFYDIGNLFLVSYFGIIFTSLASDFFPTLTNKFAQKEDVKSYVNIQIQTSILISTPLILIMYFGFDFIIPLLTSNAFLPVREILLFGLISILCKTINYPLGYIVLAIDDTKNYFYQNIIGDVLNVVLILIFFHFFGLIGIGLAMFIQYFGFNFYLWHFVSKRNLFAFDSKSMRYILVCFLFSFLIVGCEFIFVAQSLLLYISKAIVALIGVTYCIFELNKNNNFFDSLKKKFIK